MALPENQNGTPEPAAAAEVDGWPEAANPAAFYGLAGEFVESVLPHTEADAVALVTQFLAGFGSMAGPALYKVTDGARHHLNIFLVLVGETSKARKGTSWGQTIRALRLVDPDWARDRVQSGLSSGEGLAYAVRDPVERDFPVKEKGKLTGASQSVVVDKGVEDKRLLVYEPEFVSVLKTIERERNTLSALMRQAFDSGELRTLTKNSPVQATGAHISIVGHITRDELRRTLNASEAANGFGNRFDWFAVRRSKLLPEGGDLRDSDFNSLVTKVRRALDFARRGGEMRFDATARDVWCNIYSDLSRERTGLMGAILARAEAQVTRLSTIYAALDCSREIRTEHLEAALALWQYSEASAKWIFGDAIGDLDADTILSALRSQPNGLTRTEISNVFGRNLSQQRIERALAVLLSAKRAGFNPEKTLGRPTERWRAIKSE